MRAKLLMLLFLVLATSTTQAAGPAGPLRPLWDNLGGTLTSEVSCTSWSTDRIDCFARGLDNALWHISWGGATWSGWQRRGGILTSGPECVSWGANRLDCFAIGLNGALWHIWWDGAGWSAWEDLGGKPTWALNCLTRGRDRIDCFALDDTRKLLRVWWDGNQWSRSVLAKHTFGAESLNRGPECISIAPDRIDCFVADTAARHAVWHIKLEGSYWSNWENRGGFITSGLSCTTWGAGRIDCFGFPQIGSLRHMWFDGTWHPWTKLSGDLVGTPECLANPPPRPRIDCFAIGANEIVQRISWTPAGWTPLAELGAKASLANLGASHPECVAPGAYQLHCFVVGKDRELLHRSWLNPARPIEQPRTTIEGH